MVAALSILLMTALPFEKEVTFKGSGGFELKGTLAVPTSDKPVPAVLLLPGSGPTDRNGNQPPALVTNLLMEMAAHLAKEGVATLRFDKRAAAIYASKWPQEANALNEFFSWEAFVDDAKTAMNFLREQPGVDPKRVVIAGHSEGGTIAIQIGADTAGSGQAPAGLILIATPGRNYGDVLKEQVAASLDRSPLPKDQHKVYNDYVSNAIESIRKDGTLPKDPMPAGLQGLFPPSAMKLLRSYFTLDSLALARKFEGPILLMNGDKDIQVSPTKDAELLRMELSKRPKGKVELLVVPSASHNLKEVGDPNKEPGLAGPIASPVLKTISDWILKSTE